MKNKSINIIILSSVMFIMLLKYIERKQWEEIERKYINSIYMRSGMMSYKSIPYPYQPFNSQPL